MDREPIDAAILAQQNRQGALLSDIIRSGGKDGYDHLRSHGHHHATIRRAMRQGLIVEYDRRKFSITDEGRALLTLKDRLQQRSGNCDGGKQK